MRDAISKVSSRRRRLTNALGDGLSGYGGLLELIAELTGGHALFFDCRSHALSDGVDLLALTDTAEMEAGICSMEATVQRTFDETSLIEFANRQQ